MNESDFWLTGNVRLRFKIYMSMFVAFGSGEVVMAGMLFVPFSWQCWTMIIFGIVSLMFAVLLTGLLMLTKADMEADKKQELNAPERQDVQTNQ